MAVPWSEIPRTVLLTCRAATASSALSTFPVFAACPSKAGSYVVEAREIIDPIMITQVLMTILEVAGHQLPPEHPPKRVRDDVCWSDGAEKPW